MGIGQASNNYKFSRDPVMELQMRLMELAWSRVRYG